MVLDFKVRSKPWHVVHLQNDPLVFIKRLNTYEYQLLRV